MVASRLVCHRGCDASRKRPSSYNAVMQAWYLCLSFSVLCGCTFPGAIVLKIRLAMAFVAMATSWSAWLSWTPAEATDKTWVEQLTYLVKRKHTHTQILLNCDCQFGKCILVEYKYFLKVKSQMLRPTLRHKLAATFHFGRLPLSACVL